MTPCPFAHKVASLEDIFSKLQNFNVEKALFKKLPKNANDKQQLYFAKDFSLLHEMFALTLNERTNSSSTTKRNSDKNAKITEALFDTFYWVENSGRKVLGKNVKAIIYPQYPEARLSGFTTVENTMPRCMSINHVKSYPNRLLVLGANKNGDCFAFIFDDVSELLFKEIKDKLQLFGRSTVCRFALLDSGYSDKLKQLLAQYVNKPLKGCRFNKKGDTVPFNGTQVCGYTLENALGILPNANMNGDIYGIELKAHTAPKVTLFTPEPDFGLYSDDFNKFMKTYGYLDSNGDLRLTGYHVAGKKNNKSNLTLRVVEKEDEDGEIIYNNYNPTTDLTSKMHKIEIILFDEANNIAAGWSIGRLMNCWGVKHNEAVYVEAKKDINPNATESKYGYKYIVTYSQKVIWCKGTSAENLLSAINTGLIFLDPAPKLHHSNPSENKRRSQWRVNNINKAVHLLYGDVKTVDVLTP